MGRFVHVSRSQSPRNFHHLGASSAGAPGQVLMRTRLRDARVSRLGGVAIGALALSFLLFCAGTVLGAEPKYPQLSGRVVDDAGVLTASTKSQLTDMLAEHERTTGQQVVVVTLPSLQGFPIEDFGYQLGRHWGIGQKGTNTGALLIVAPNEHKV